MAYQLKVTLMENEPPIWRRLRVPGNTTLPRLDRIIQTAMGWTNSHLHTFTAGGVIYAVPDPEWAIHVKDERRVRLNRIAKEACPPEDCGGVHGYYGTLEILRNPRHKEYRHTKTWIESMTGGPFDADGFDVEAVNAALKALRWRSSRI